MLIVNYIVKSSIRFGTFLTLIECTNKCILSNPCTKSECDSALVAYAIESVSLSLT